MPIPPEAPVGEIGSLYGVERERLLRTLEGLTEPDWHRSTPCPGWTVLGLACHLLGNDLSLLSRRRDDHMGTPAPPDLSEPEFIDWLDDLQVEWVHAARRLSPRVVIELLRWAGPQVIETFRCEDPTEPAAIVSWADSGPVPIWLDQLRELSECWIHRQQILDALGRASDLDHVLLHPILLGLRWAFPHRLSRSAPVVERAAIQISIGEPIHERWTLTSNNGDWTFRDRPEGEVIARASFTADQCWRLLTNNLTQPEGALDITGEPETVEAVLSARAIIGHPK